MTGTTRSQYAAAPPAPGSRTTRISGLPRHAVADRLDVVAVGVADETAVVLLVVLREVPRLVQHLGPEADRSLDERVHGLAVRRGEGEVHLAVGPEVLVGELRDPEVGLAGAVAHGDLEVLHAGVAERGQHGVVELLRG